MEKRTRACVEGVSRCLRANGISEGKQKKEEIKPTELHDVVTGDGVVHELASVLVVPHVTKIPPPLPWISGGVSADVGSSEDLEERN